MDTVDSAVHRSQTSGMGPSSQAERRGTPASHGTGEPTYGIQQDISLPEFEIKETEGSTPTYTLQSLEREVMKLRQQVNKETLPTERGVPFDEHIMEEELPTHFRAPAHLSVYDGSADPSEHICKFENAAVLHRYADKIKCCVFLTTLTGSAQHWFDQLPAGSIRSFAEFSSLFLHQFASSRKYKKSAIILFGVKQDERETLRTYVQRFHTAVLEIPAPHQEVLISAFTQGLRGGPLFDSLAKRPAVDFLDVLVRTEKVHELGGCPINNKEWER
ncbi:UNVERIFIED_CONTAM: hypothetical protein Slati_0425400 [Sesamum latifolium]|uniref:Retrotransposon gag domain-containing protein n=1 Tax=Sesamum latifolium TaxID=2727402 RepID=A0AAW2XYE2_9LAMI